jgi:hypothetical protein
MLPGNQLGGEVAVSVARDQAFVELGYIRWSAVTLPDEVGHVDFGLWTIDSRIGWRADRSDGTDGLPLAAWLLGEVGRSTATGHDVLGGEMVSSSYAAVGGGIGVHGHVSRWIDAMLAIEGLDAVLRPRFETANDTLIFAPGAFAARFSLGISATWR